MGRAGAATDQANTGRAFVDLYRRAVPDVYSYLASRVGDRGTAEDLTQEVFIAGAHRAARGEAVDLRWWFRVTPRESRSRGRDGRTVVAPVDRPKRD